MIRRMVLGAFAAALAAQSALTAAAGQSGAATGRTAHAFAFTDIDGAPMPLAQFAGRPMLVVNTASKCGFTGQYAGLQELWTRFGPEGLVVIGVPSDQFNQELREESAVKTFCELNYGVSFPLTEITAVRGDKAHPFYVWAAAELGPAQAPRWNFHKYLVDGEGRLVAAFGTGVEPTAPQVVSKIESLLPNS
jgi:glutathione peroxidase